MKTAIHVCILLILSAMFSLGSAADHTPGDSIQSAPQGDHDMGIDSSTPMKRKTAL